MKIINLLMPGGKKRSHILEQTLHQALNGSLISGQCSNFTTPENISIK